VPAESVRDSIRVLAMIEAGSITGPAKAVLAFAQEAMRGQPDVPQIELSIATFNRSLNENTLEAAIRDIGIPLDIVRERIRFDIGVIAQLRQIVKERSTDILWSHSVKSHFLVRLAGLNRSRGWVAFHHGYTSTDFKMRVYNQLDRWSLPAADRVLVSSIPFVKEMERRNVQLDRIHVQHAPIHPFKRVAQERTAELRRRLGLNNLTRVLLSVGRLSREKGHADLIRAFPKMRAIAGHIQFRLVLVGEGPERAKIEKLCRDLALSDDVTLTGHQNDVSPYYAIADVLLLPSHTEGCPNVVLEAMAAGVPVVSTDVGGVPELASNGRAVALVAEHDMAGLLSSAFQLCVNRQYRDNLVSCAREVVSAKTSGNYFRSIVSVFERVFDK
jgi:glycosyltransferase involved in cell wall biosynthesis